MFTKLLKLTKPARNQTCTPLLSYDGWITRAELRDVLVNPSVMCTTVRIVSSKKKLVLFDP